MDQQKKLDVIKISALNMIDSRLLKEDEKVKDYVMDSLFTMIGRQLEEDHEKFNLEIIETEIDPKNHYDVIPAQTEFRLSVNFISDEKLRYYQLMEKEYNKLLAEKSWGFER